MKLHLKKCVEEDVKTLLQISKITFIESFEEQINACDFRKYINTAFTREMVLSQLKNKRSHFYFIYTGNDLTGYFKLNEAGAQNDINDPDSVELERIYILKQFQGQKIGVCALNNIIQIALNLQADYLWLGVWQNNQSAIRFYERNGFKKFGEHPSIVSDTIPPDWLMKRAL